MIPLAPLFDRVAVERIEFDAKNHLPGLIVSTAQPDDIERGKVVAVGRLFLPNGGTEELPVKVGDVVIYKRGTGTKVLSFKQNYTLLSMREVFAVETQPKEEQS